MEPNNSIKPTDVNAIKKNVETQPLLDDNDKERNEEKTKESTIKQTNLNTIKKDVEKQPLLGDNNDDKSKGDDKHTGRTLKELFLLLTLACFSRFLVAVSRICVQALEDRVPAFQLSAMRCGLPLCCWSLYLVLTRKLPRVEFGNIKACGLWSINQALTSITAYICVVFIPLATVETVCITSNIMLSLVTFGLILKGDSHWSQVFLIRPQTLGSLVHHSAKSNIMDPTLI